MSAPGTASHAARYQYERRLGEGGSGAVYLVRDLETGEHVALKKLLRVDAKSAMRLKRELRAMQSVNHPHIIKLYDMGRVEDSWFMTTEYIAAISAHAMRACVAFLRGKPVEAVQHMRTALERVEKVGYRHQAERTRFALGVLLGGPEGAGICAGARAAIAQRGAADVDGDLRAQYPELTKAGSHVSR